MKVIHICKRKIEPEKTFATFANIVLQTFFDGNIATNKKKDKKTNFLFYVDNSQRLQRLQNAFANVLNLKKQRLQRRLQSNDTINNNVCKMCPYRDTFETNVMFGFFVIEKLLF